MLKRYNVSEMMFMMMDSNVRYINENYKVDTNGVVYSRSKRFSLQYRALKPQKNKGGHCMVYLSENGVQKWHYVHRLVAEAFIPNPENKSEVHHIDKNPENNCVDNLMWVTHKEHQLIHNQERPKRIEKPKKKKASPVKQYSKDGTLVNEWPSIVECENQTGFDGGNISKCCSGKRKTAYGYIWKYKK